jgi:SRSO17 transposase
VEAGVGLRFSSGGIESRFEAYVEALAVSLGHADRAAPFRSYCAGLILPGDRKSVEPMAARVEPGRVQAAHQSLHHMVAKAEWSDQAVLARVRDQVLPKIVQSGGILAWIIDDTGFPKKGTHSVGVARQYCGQLGKQDNCQVAVTLSVANDHASLPIDYRLYLPEPWANDPERRARAGVPDDAEFQTKLQIALAQIRSARDAHVPQGCILADAGYGIDTEFRDGIAELQMTYVVGVQSSTSLWPPGEAPLPVKPPGGRGRPSTRVRRTATHKPVSAKALAHALPEHAWQTVTWRECTNAPLSGRFAAVRVRPAHRDVKRSTPRPEEWFMVEWPEGDAEPAKYWLATLPADTPVAVLVATAKRRWRIKRDYQELKGEIGLGHYEGRGWRGFHHHATLCIAAYGFLIAERSAFPPSADTTIRVKSPAIPANFRPRGSANPT